MNEAWNYLQNGAAQGPVTTEALRALLASGQLGPEDLVWRPSLAEWTQAGQCPELRSGPALPPPSFQLSEPSLPAPVEPAPFPEPAAGDLDAAIEALAATKPWVRLMGVLGILGVLLLVVGALVFFAVANAIPGPFANFPAGMRLLVAGLYLVMGALQLPPVLFLHSYANRIGRLVRERTPQALAGALRAQKAFWLYVGVFTLVILCLYALVFLGIIAIAVIAGARRHF